MFIGLLRVVPGGRPFVASNPLTGPQHSTVDGPWRFGQVPLIDPLATCRQEAHRRAARHARTSAAWTAGRVYGVASPTPPFQPPRPASASGVLIKRPSVGEAGYMEYSL